MGMAFPVESAPEFDEWMTRLADMQADAVAVVVAAFATHADALGSAVVKPIKTSRHAAMRELRIQTIRVPPPSTRAEFWCSCGAATRRGSGTSGTRRRSPTPTRSTTGTSPS
jgi:hypothetical protein